MRNVCELRVRVEAPGVSWVIHLSSLGPDLIPQFECALSLCAYCTSVAVHVLFTAPHCALTRSLLLVPSAARSCGRNSANSARPRRSYVPHFIMSAAVVLIRCSPLSLLEFSSQPSAVSPQPAAPLCAPLRHAAPRRAARNMWFIHRNSALSRDPLTTWQILYRQRHSLRAFASCIYY